MNECESIIIRTDRDHLRGARHTRCRLGLARQPPRRSTPERHRPHPAPPSKSEHNATWSELQSSPIQSRPSRWKNAGSFANDDFLFNCLASVKCSENHIWWYSLAFVKPHYARTKYAVLIVLDHVLVFDSLLLENLVKSNQVLITIVIKFPLHYCYWMLKMYVLYMDVALYGAD